MKHKGSLVISLLLGSLLMASSCVDCHTDVEQLKSIAKTLPQKEASAETAGKG